MRILLIPLITCAAAAAATFGTAVPIVGGATDIALDEARSRVYIVNTTQNRIDVYSTAQKRFLNPITVSQQPLSEAMSRSGQYLYVTAYAGSSLDIVDLDAAMLVKRVSLPAAPEGVAVGVDERVLVTTVGSGTNNADNRVMLYDPSIDGTDSLRAVATTLPAPAIPQTPAPSSRVFMSTRSNLVASADGNWIIGLNNPTTTSRQLFVLEVASGSILRSRTVTSISNVLSVSPDGSKFMAGLSLFDTATLAIIAQQNTANSMYPFATTANFNTQQNQGGSVFSRDGATVYSAFNISPVQNPAAAANVSQLMLSDSDNLLIQLGLQLPENLTGNMVVSKAGDTIYALSQSGFLIVPISTIYDNPIATVNSPAIFLTSDQCGATASTQKAQITVTNAGKGRMTANAQVMQTGVTTTFPIGGFGNGGAGVVIGGGGAGGGAGAGAPGGRFPIILPPGLGGIGGGQIQIPTGPAPTGAATTTAAQQTGIAQNAPSVRVVQNTGTATTLEFSYNVVAKSLGTIAPTDFLVQSPEAINIPFRVRAYQNYRNSEARGTVVPVPVSISTAEGLVDIVSDTTRQRLYIANSGMNRVEIFDTVANQFLTPIKVGQLPRSLAITPNNKFLYVGNSGGESITIIDLDQGVVTGKVKFPPVAYNASYALNTPSIIVSTMNGLLVMMSDGTLWNVVNDEALPRRTSPAIGTATITAPRTMAATPGGEYALLLGGTGTAYLYDATADDFVLSQTVVSAPIQGYFGPVTAGPRGQYYVVNGNVLNQTLTAVTASAPGGNPGGGGAPPGNGGGTPPGGGGQVIVNLSRPTAAVAMVNATTIARFAQPVRSSATATVTETPSVDLIDVTTLTARGTAPVLEGPLATLVGTQRVNVNGRTMAMDAAGTTAYVLTTTGLSISSFTTQTPGSTPAIKQNGVMNSADYQPSLAPGALVSVFGANLGASSSNNTAPYGTIMGGVCVTVDDVPMPLLLTSGGQINGQLRPDLKVGRHSMVVRSIDQKAASSAFSITIAKYAPAVFVNQETGQAAIFHSDGSPVSKDNKASRDEPLVLLAGGLGVTHGATVTAGAAVPQTPAALTDKVQVFFGDPKMKQSEVIVDSSSLAPGLVGIYQLALRVPGFHTNGDNLPVTLRIGGVDSVTTGSLAPKVFVD